MTNSGTLRKGPEAFRTISEVAEAIKLPQHVLRFWETRFVQIRPLKRAGGRRFYRPDDVDLLIAIRQLLYGEGYTIRGVQRLLKERGPRGVAALVREGAPQGSVPDHGNPDAGAYEPLEEAADIGSNDQTSRAFEPSRFAYPAQEPIPFEPSSQSVAPQSATAFRRSASSRAEQSRHNEPAAKAVGDLLYDLKAALGELAECRRILQSARGSD